MTRSYFGFNFLEGVIGCECDFKTSSGPLYNRYNERYLYINLT